MSRTRAILALVLALAAIAVAADYEKPPVLPAKDIVPASILAGKGYTIDAKGSCRRLSTTCRGPSASRASRIATI
jgi:hypothetical protein